MVSAAIYHHFAQTVDDYDTVAGKVVFENEALHNQLINGLPFDALDEISALDLGAGTGHGATLFLDVYVNSRIICVDFSRRMARKCQENLKGYGDRFKLVEGDFTQMDLGQNYDAIISAVAIHNISHAEKEQLFERIYRALKVGGVFANADFVQGETAEQEKYYREVYRKYLESNLCGEELQVWLRHAFEEDMPMKYSEQCYHLSKIGFTKVRALWQCNNELVYTAIK